MMHRERNGWSHRLMLSHLLRLCCASHSNCQFPVRHPRVSRHCEKYLKTHLFLSHKQTDHIYRSKYGLSILTLHYKEQTPASTTHPDKTSMLPFTESTHLRDRERLTSGSLSSPHASPELNYHLAKEPEPSSNELYLCHMYQLWSRD